MSKNMLGNKLKNRLGNKLKNKKMLVSIFLILVLVVLVDISTATDCSKCHKAALGKSIKAIDTIEVTEKTCLKCHNPEYPPSLIGYNTHLVHVGKYSAKVDYLKRHPGVADSFSCNNCHVNIGDKCQNCHTKNLPHIEPPLGYNCKGCHGELDRLFRHQAIDLKIHDLFNVGDTTACNICHNPDDMTSLKLASGQIVPMRESHRLCFQCHSSYYNLWISGLHYSNITIPSDDDIRGSYDVYDISRIKVGLESKWREDNTCVNCHNAHNPRELYQLPILKLEKAVTVTEVVKSNVIYIAVLVAIIVVVAIFVIKKKKLKLPELKLSKLKELRKPGLPKFRLPKISIPISVSVEELDSKGEPIKKEEPVKEEEKKKEPVKEEEKKKEPVQKLEETEGQLIKKTEYLKSLEPVQKLEETDGQLIKKTEYLKSLEPVQKLEETDGQLIKKTEYLKGLEPADKIDKKDEKEGFLYRHRKDILFILTICIIFGSFYVVFGTFVPIAAVTSESMSPNIEKGDIVFYADINKIDEISTHDEKNSISFDNYGDVILYKPFGEEDAIPYVHRVMYYVGKGDEMWPDGPKAPHSGYITKGDNIFTNRQYDQQGSISLNQPVKEEWIIGVARFRIPYIGYIRTILP